MYLRNKRILIYHLALFFFIGCSNNSIETKEKTGVVLKHNKLKIENEEWYSFVDSVSNISIKAHNYFIDSISLYYMRLNTPSVVSKPRYVFWSNDIVQELGVFDFFTKTTDLHFVIGTMRKRTVSITSFLIGQDTLHISKEEILNLNKDLKFSDPCCFVSQIEQSIINQNLNVKIEIFQSCLDEVFYKDVVVSNLWTKNN